MELSGWGRYPRIQTQGISFEKAETLQAALARSTKDSIPYGLGRSYGDSALNSRVIFSRRFNKLLAFDEKTGCLRCESGVSLAEIIAVFLPRGWFLSVTPGTRFVTVGGAIASDVHGKNHHQAGCFGQWVKDFELMLPSGEIRFCSREQNSRLFHATCGGMGLTGVILRATLILQPVQSAYIRETVIPCPDLEAVFEAFERYQAMPYSVAWLDCLAKGRALGRSVLMLGEHAQSGPLDIPSPPRRQVPFELPGFCLNRYSVAGFNWLYYRKNGCFVQGRLTPLEQFFYPLDSISHWNRMYGAAGFTQYQFVLPKENSFAGLCEILDRIAQAGKGSFLAVLKLFGKQNQNPLSFPREGYTLALDFKMETGLFAFLDELDERVLAYGGRVYLTKDVRLSRAAFRAGYPRWREFTELRAEYGLNSRFNSLQSRRLEI